MQWCHTYCFLLHTHCLVLSHNTIYSSLKRECVAWWNQITVVKGTMLILFLYQRENKNYSSTDSYLKNISPIYPNQRCILISNEWRYIEQEKRIIFQRGLLDWLLPNCSLKQFFLIEKEKTQESCMENSLLGAFHFM